MTISKTGIAGKLFYWLRQPEHLPRWALLAIATTISVYFVAVAAVCPGPSLDIRVMAGVLVLAIAAILVTRWRAPNASWLEQAALYLAAVIAVYFDRQTQTMLETRAAWQLVLFAALVLAVIVRFRLASDRRFRMTTLDALVIFVAVVVPNLPGSIISAATLGESIAKLVALMYGVETIVGAAGRWWRLPSLAALGLLGTCIVRGSI